MADPSRSRLRGRGIFPPEGFKSGHCDVTPHQLKFAPNYARPEKLTPHCFNYLRSVRQQCQHYGYQGIGDFFIAPPGPSSSYRGPVYVAVAVLKRPLSFLSRPAAPVKRSSKLICWFRQSAGESSNYFPAMPQSLFFQSPFV